jgi:hypothetical protein
MQDCWGLIQDLYSAHVDNRAFLHARFGLADDVLQPYKKTIEKWLYPVAFWRGEISPGLQTRTQFYFALITSLAMVANCMFDVPS